MNPRQGQTTFSSTAGGFMATKKTRKKKAKPFWERAYKGHAYWLGKTKLGKVTLLAGPKGDTTGKAVAEPGTATRWRRPRPRSSSPCSTPTRSSIFFRPDFRS